MTPRNILHASRRRNDALARVFHDLGLMLSALIGEDLTRYPNSSSSEVNRRIGAEISAKTVRGAVSTEIGISEIQSPLIWNPTKTRSRRKSLHKSNPVST